MSSPSLANYFAFWKGTPQTREAEEKVLQNSLKKLEDDLRRKEYLNAAEQKASSDLVFSGIYHASVEVQGQAQLCLSFLVKKVGYVQLVELTKHIWDLFVVNHDNPSYEALRIIVLNIPEADPRIVTKEASPLHSAFLDFITPQLVPQLNDEMTVFEQKYSLLNIILHRFWGLLRRDDRFKDMQFVGSKNEYFCTHEVGSGQYAKVLLAFHTTTGKPVAIKIMDWNRLTGGRPGGKIEQQLGNEITVMREAIHRNIVRLYDVVHATKTNPNLYLIMEYCNMGTLESFLKTHKRLSEEDAKRILTQLAQGFKLLRSKKIIHRDLKPANILLTTGDQGICAKIADFTFARYMETHDLATTMCGSPMYMGPEIFKDKKYTDKADLWSLGVIFFELLCGQVPYNVDDYYSLLSALNEKPIVLPAGINLSPQCHDLLFSLLQKDPLHRISWEEFFTHPFIYTPQPLPASRKEPQDTKKYAEVEKSLEAANKQVKDLQDQLKDQENKSNEKIRKLEEELANFRKNQDQGQNEVVEARRQIETMKNSITAMNTKFSQQKEEHEKVLQTVMTNSRKALDEQIAKFDQEKKNIQEHLQQESKKEIERETQKLTEVIGELKDQLTKTTEERDQLSHSKLNLEEKFKNMSLDVQTRENELKNQEKVNIQLEELANKREQLERELSSAKEQNSTSIQSIKQLRKENEQLTNDIDLRDQKITALSVKLEDTTNQISLLLKESSSKKELEKSFQKKLITANESLISELNQAHGKIKELQDRDLQAVGQDFTVVSRDQDADKIHHLELELNNKNDTIKHNETIINEAFASLDKAQLQLQACEKALMTANTTAECAKKEITEKDTAINNLQQGTKTLQDQVQNFEYIVKILQEENHATQKLNQDLKQNLQQYIKPPQKK